MLGELDELKLLSRSGLGERKEKQAITVRKIATARVRHNMVSIDLQRPWWMIIIQGPSAKWWCL